MGNLGWWFAAGLLVTLIVVLAYWLARTWLMNWTMM